MNRKSFFFLVLFHFLCSSLIAQKNKLSEFYLIQRQYESLAENDSTALPLVQELIKRAKKKSNRLQLYLGYKDARYYSPDPQRKLKYADSAIFVALEKKDDSLLSSAYMSKGIVYYFYLKKYRLALNEYLKAFEKNKKNKDLYNRNKINYHIGVVKNYIGFYQDALDDFEEARRFYESEIKTYMHPNLMFGYQRGYNNTLHQMAVSYRNLGKYKKSDSLIVLGLSSTGKNADFKQEYSYFLKESGISKYRKANYIGAIQDLQHSLPALIAINDFAWLTVSYSYLGKAQLKLGNEEEGIMAFEKIDSIFNKHSFVLPEVRDVYEHLITYYKNKSNSAKALYYTMQLIKVDKVLEKDFVYLTPKIHKEYDSQKLLEEKVALEERLSSKRYIFIVLSFFSLSVVGYLMWRSRSGKKANGKKGLLEVKFPYSLQEGTFRIRHYNKAELSTEIVEDILEKLSEFESNRGYLKSGTELKSLAVKFGVSPKNLSSVIKEHKGASFNRYLSELRIHYITEKLYTEPLFRKYSSATLAKECGIASRTNFSALFKEINGISFSEFINKFKLENEIMADS